MNGLNGLDKAVYKALEGVERPIIYIIVVVVVVIVLVF